MPFVRLDQFAGCVESLLNNPCCRGWSDPLSSVNTRFDEHDGQIWLMSNAKTHQVAAFETFPSCDDRGDVVVFVGDFF